jgi:hypothetical protein
MIEWLMDVLIDTVKDTLELVPFLFVTYLAMEALEHSTEGKSEQLIRKAGAWGPLVGGLLGALPQCGFSTMAGTLYAGRLVTAGTLVAVILSTSDELIPIFIARQAMPSQLLGIIVTKVIIGVAVGFAADAVLRALHRTGDGHPHIQELCERAHCHCGDVDEDDPLEVTGELSASSNGHVHHAHAHGHHGRGARWLHILRSAAIHTLEVTGFIFVIGFVFGFGIEFVGQDTIGGIFSAYPTMATIIAALIGLIPNCGASVAIAELYLDGTLATGPMLAGLLVSGGMGLLVLYRTNADVRQNVIITVFIFVVGVLMGMLATAMGLTFA